MTPKPIDESLSDTSRAVLSALSRGTTLGKSILKAQCELLGYDPQRLEAVQLKGLVPRLLDAAGHFGAPAKVDAIREALDFVVSAAERQRSEGRHDSHRTSSVGKRAAREEPSVRASATTSPGDTPSSGYRRVAAKFEPLGDFARQVQGELLAYSPLAWPLLEAQCQRRDKSAPGLRPSDLMALLPELERSLRLFGSPDGAAAVCHRLDYLIRRAG